MYSDLLKLVFEKFEKDYNNINDLIMELNKLFSDISPCLNIGKIVLETERKVNIYSNRLFSNELILFDNNDYDENNNFVFERNVKSLGKYSIKISIKKGHILTDEEKVTLKSLLSFERARSHMLYYL